MKSEIEVICQKIFLGDMVVLVRLLLTSPPVHDLQFQGNHCTGKTGKRVKKNPCRGKQREFGKFAKTQGKRGEFGLLKL